MTRYTVWWTTGKADGDAGYDSLDEAMERFDEVKARKDIAEAAIADNSDDSTIIRYDASDEQD